MTVDVIIYDGSIKCNDTIVVGSLAEPIITKIKALFEPAPLAEMHDKKTKFESVNEVSAASGVKIAAPELNEVVAGMPLRSCEPSDIEKVKEEIKKEVEEAYDIVKNNLQSLVEYDSILRLQIMLWGVGEKNDDKINEVYKNLLAINDQHQRVHFAYFNYLAISEQWDRALALLDKVISDEPEVYYPYWYKSKIYLFCF